MSLKLNERYPGRFDSPTSDYPYGSFKNRTTPTSKDGSYLEKDWANDKEGFFQSLLSAAGITANGSVDKVGSSQFYNALLQLSQSQAGVAFTTTGTASAFNITPPPAITAYAVNQRFQVTFHVAGGATPTLNASALGPKNLKQYNSSGVKVAAVIAANQTTDIIYDGTDLVLIDPLPGAAGNQFSRITTINSSTTLTAATSTGALIMGTSGTPFPVNLPAASTMAAGAVITFWNFSFGTMTINRAGADNIYTPTTTTSLSIPSGIQITLTCDGAAGWYVLGVPNSVGISSAFKNLTGSATGLNAVASYAADELIVFGSNLYQTLRSVSIAPSFAVAGAGGLDVGAANSQTASTWYSVWVIWNGSTVAGLFSASATNPTMPAGYTHKARVGWVRTDGTANKYPLRFFQGGRTVQYSVATTGNTLNAPVMVSGASGNVTAPTYTAVPVASFIPPTAVKIKLSIRGTENGMVFLCAPNGSYGNNQAETSPPAFMGLPSAQGGVIVYPFEFVIEEANIYYASNAANSRLRCMGWEDNI